MTKSEIWKDVAGYEGLYKVSNKGNVYSVARKDSRWHRRGGQRLKPVYDRGGYLIVSLYKNGKSKTKKVHRLVAEAFIPNPNGLPQVNHRDKNKVNNNVENLKWCDARYNSNHGTRNEKVTQVLSKKSELLTLRLVMSSILTQQPRLGAKAILVDAYHKPLGEFTTAEICIKVIFGLIRRKNR